MLPVLHAAPRLAGTDLHRLLRPLAASLFIHALLVATGGPTFPISGSPSGGNPVHARLHRPPTAPPSIEAPAAHPAEDVSEATVARAPVERHYPPPPEPGPVETTGEAGSPASGAPVETPPPATRGIEVAALRDYHLALGRAARQFRRYPPAALDAGWQGRVMLRLTVSEQGTPQRLQLIGSSGHAILDEAGAEIILLAANHTLPPESLRGQRFDIDLALDFNPAEFREATPPRP